MKIIPVILSGGVGSRLWPVSRESHPKPFMKLPDGRNLIQHTFLRACSVEGVQEVLTVTNRELLFKTEDEYGKLAVPGVLQSYILEPYGRNTAAAIAAAAIHLAEVYDEDCVVLILAADHLIADEVSFNKSVAKARELAEKGYLVTFGIKPTYPETGFGYVEADHQQPLSSGYKVKRFVEKPDLNLAKAYLEQDSFFWNSGMFCFRVSAVLGEFRKHSPEILDSVVETIRCSKLSVGNEQRTLSLNSDLFVSVPSTSIDYAVMEKSSLMAIIPSDIGWSDIGSWDAVSALTDADVDGNRFLGEVFSHKSHNNYVQSEQRVAALLGVDDLIVVDTPDALLISHNRNAQDVRLIVEKLKRASHPVHISHQTVYRPWGTYTIIENGERFKIKRIVVKPKASLSLQMHHHRSEHWIVVSGMAVVLNDHEELMLNTNESTFIRAGHKHRLQNPGVIDLVLIEVQSGDYLGEDDIVRFEDNYGRV